MDEVVSRCKPASVARQERWLYLGLGAVIALLMLLDWFPAYSIPAASMAPALEVGDFILVDSRSYGMHRPLLHLKVWEVAQPQRGEVAVFRYPQNPMQTYIKRIVGVPGDQVDFNEGILSINGKALPKILEPELGDASFEHFYREQLGSHEYVIRELNGAWSARHADFVNSLSSDAARSEGHRWSVKVPEDQYFMLGDNRDNSRDSRFWGFVPEENLVGRAACIWMHRDPGLHLPTFSHNVKSIKLRERDCLATGLEILG